MGPLRKLVLLNILNAPFYFYFYNDITNRYQNLEKHLVTKYLIIGDELLYKSRKSLWNNKEQSEWSITNKAQKYK